MNLYEGKSLSHATADIKEGKIVGISQDADLANKKLGAKTSQDALHFVMNLQKVTRLLLFWARGKMQWPKHP